MPMRYKLVTHLSFGLAVLSCASLADTSYQAPLVEQSLLLDIEQVENQLIAVGERGHILLSNDGEAWEQQTVPTVATLTSVSFVGAKGWVVGHDASILHLPSKDAQWQVQMYNPDLERPLLDVLFFDEKHGIAIGAYGTFFRSMDGGQSWESELHPEFLNPDDQAYLEEIKLEDEEFYQEELASILPHLNRVSRNGDTLYLAGETGLLASSSDFGRSWQRLEISYQGSFFDIKMTEQQRLIAAGLRGNLFEFDSQTGSWNRLESSSKASLNSIVSLSDRSVLVVGNNGSLVCVEQDAVAQSQTQDNEAIINAVEFNNQLIAVTAVGIQKHSLSQGSTICNRTSTQ